MKTTTDYGKAGIKYSMIGYALTKLAGYSFEQGSRAAEGLNDFANDMISPVIGVVAGVTLDGIITKAEKSLPKVTRGLIEAGAVMAILAGGHYLHEMVSNKTSFMSGTPDTSVDAWIGYAKYCANELYHSARALLSGDISYIEPQYAGALYMTARATYKIGKNIVSGLKKAGQKVSEAVDRAGQKREMREAQAAR